MAPSDDRSGKAATPLAKPARKPLSPAAERAFGGGRAPPRAEAPKSPAAGPKEIGGPAGLEPTRYGDWEKKGLTSDF